MNVALDGVNKGVNKGFSYMPYIPSMVKNKEGADGKPGDAEQGQKQSGAFLDPRTPAAYVIARTPSGSALGKGPSITPLIFTPLPTAGAGHGDPLSPISPMPEEGFEVDDEFDLPVSVALILLLLYMLIGAAIFSYSEDWSLFEAFYFVYISLSTIGFGE